MGIDVTGNAGGQIAAAMAALPAEAQPLIASLMDRIDALEAKEAADLNALADKVIAAVTPQLQAITETVNGLTDQALGVVRRIDGLTLTMKLGPAPVADTTVTVAS
jgi:hypothetical protein